MKEISVTHIIHSAYTINQLRFQRKHLKQMVRLGTKEKNSIPFVTLARRIGLYETAKSRRSIMRRPPVSVKKTSKVKMRHVARTISVVSIKIWDSMRKQLSITKKHFYLLKKGDTKTTLQNATIILVQYIVLSVYMKNPLNMTIALFSFTRQQKIRKGK